MDSIKSSIPDNFREELDEVRTPQEELFILEKASAVLGGQLIGYQDAIPDIADKIQKALSKTVGQFRLLEALGLAENQTLKVIEQIKIRIIALRNSMGLLGEDQPELPMGQMAPETDEQMKAKANKMRIENARASIQGVLNQAIRKFEEAESEETEELHLLAEKIS